MNHLTDHELLAILREDCPYSDLTTEGLGLADLPARARLTARDPMVVCAIEEAARMFELCGAAARRLLDGGARAEPGQLLIEVEGRAGAIHRAYKMAQTLMEVSSGIATSARAIVEAAQGANPATRVACTRKHLPGAKRLMLKAIEQGGATPHRLGLSDFVLVFEEHRVLTDPALPLARHLSRLAAASPERRVAVEVTTLEEALEAAGAGADIVQIDKASPALVAEVAGAFQSLARRPKLAAAGGINPGNAAAYAGAGADILVTSAPYYAPPRDVKVRISPA